MERKLIEKIPRYYRNSRIMKQLLDAAEFALDKAEEKVESTSKQCLISTADTSLSRWEKIYGIPTSADEVNRRRERVLARKRGNKTGTLANLKSVISAFSNGAVEIEEIYDEYRVNILFDGAHGSPPHMSDVLAAIDEIIPAHIAVTVSLAVEVGGGPFVMGGITESCMVTEIYPKREDK